MSNSTSAMVELMAFQRQTEALSAVAERLAWDQETVMPRGAAEQRSEEMAAMEAVLHERRTDPRLGEWLDAATPESDREARILELIGREFARASAIPADLATEMARLTSLAQGIWAQARANDAPGDFLPTLDEVLTLKREEADAYVAAGFGKGDRYDALLDDYEPDTSAADIARLFDTLRPRLVSLRDAVMGAERQPERLAGHFAQEAQMRLARACATASLAISASAE